MVTQAFRFVYSLLIRKDLRDLFEQLAISYRSMAVNATPKTNGVKGKPDQSRKPQKLGETMCILKNLINIFSCSYLYWSFIKLNITIQLSLRNGFNIRQIQVLRYQNVIFAHKQ